jgi:hypothetical protein
MNQPKIIQILTRSLFLGLIALLMISGCDKNQLASLDSKNSTPIVSQLRFSPDSVYIDNLTPVNGQYTITTTVRAAALDNDGYSDLAAITVDVLRSNGVLAIGGVALKDDGVLPDSIRPDGIFSGLVNFSLTRAQSGQYQIRVSAIDKQGSVSNSLAGEFKLTRRNSAPTLFNVVMPDTVDLPNSGYITVQFTASASDSDGLADIRQVFFRRLAPFDSSQTRFIMKDDGSLEPPITVGGISVRSGDNVAGDGRFSFLIPLLSTSTRRTSLFDFQAVDTFGDTSASVQMYLTVR